MAAIIECLPGGERIGVYDGVEVEHVGHMRTRDEELLLANNVLRTLAGAQQDRNLVIEADAEHSSAKGEDASLGESVALRERNEPWILGGEEDLDLL